MGKKIDKLIDRLLIESPNIIEFDYMQRDKVVAKVKINLKENTVTQDLYTDNLLDRPITSNKIGLKEVMYFFESRCFPRERFNAKQLLSDLGLDHYNPYDIVRKTRGLLWDDYYWIRFKGDNISYEEIKLRD